MTRYEQPSGGEYDLYEILLHYGWNIRSRPSGWTTIKCQFHDDSRASMRVNYDLGGYICMACGAKGDTIAVIRHYEKVGFREAVGIAERITGEGGGSLLRQRGRGSGVPQGTRDHRGGRKYVPPRLRGRPAAG